MVAIQGCFPRGGRNDNSVASSGKKRKNEDVLFGTKSEVETEKIVKKKPKKENAKPKDVLKQKNKSTLASIVSFKTLSKGSLLFGCIKQVNDYELLITLPYNLTGVVSVKESSDLAHKLISESQEDKITKLDSLFSVGQYVPCCVLKLEKTDKGKRIELSLRVSEVNKMVRSEDVVKGTTLYGNISSIEDHGAIVDFGIKGITGFVPNKHINESGFSLLEGQLMYTCVDAINEHTRTATVSISRDATVKCVTKDKNPKLRSLTPGKLLNVKVEERVSNGLVVSFLTLFKGTVEYNHMSHPCFPGWEDAYPVKTKARARIIWINHSTKTIALSMIPFVVHLQTPTSIHKVGDVIQNATIQRIDRGIGMLLSLSGTTTEKDSRPSWADYQPAYVHISRILDSKERIEKLDRKFKVGETVENCRILDFSPFDGLANVTMKQSAINQPVVLINDLKAGQIVNGKIASVQKWGILVEFGEGLRGLIPPQHLPKIALKKSQPKYHVGNKIQTRVLSVNVETQKTYLTAKSLLVKSTLPPLTSFEEAKQNMIAEGFISKIADFGLIVTFYNNVHGLVRMSDLRDHGVEDISASYIEGQVVKACILSCDASKGRMKLSLDVSHAHKGLETSQESDEQLNAGDVVSCTIVESNETFYRVKTAGGTIGVLDHAHLTDYSEEIPTIIANLAVGNSIEKALVLDNPTTGSITVSIKPSFLSLNGGFVIPDKFDDLSVGIHALGFIRSIRSFGIFVQFINGLQGLCPLSQIADRFVSDPSELFSIGDTIRCVVQQVDTTKRQFIVSMKRSVCDSKDVDYVRGLLGHRCEKIGNNDDEQEVNIWSKYGIGISVYGEVLATRDYGTVLSFEDDFMALIPSDNNSLVSGTKYEDGDKVLVRILDYDFEKNLCIVSDNKDLVKGGKRKAIKRARKFNMDEKINGTAVHLNKEYAIINAEDSICVLQLADYHCPYFSSENAELTVGKSLNVTVSKLGEALLTKKHTPFDSCVFVKITASVKRVKRALPNSGTLVRCSSNDLVHGGLITGRIKMIKEDYMELEVQHSLKACKVVVRASIADVDSPEMKELDTQSHPFDQYQIDQVVRGRVLSVHSFGANSRMGVSSENPAVYQSVVVSLRKEDVECELKTNLRVPIEWHEKELKEGSSLSGVIVEALDSGIFIQISHNVRGFCQCLDASHSLEELKSFKESFPIGKRVSCFVKSYSLNDKRLNLSLFKPESLNYVPGQIAIAQVNLKAKAINPPCLMMQLGKGIVGRVCITELSEPQDWIDSPLETRYTHGAFFECAILSKSGQIFDLSLRNSRITNAKTNTVTSKNSSLPEVGDLINGYVISTNSSGCFIRLERELNARVLLRNLSDKFIESPSKMFPVGKLVAGRVLKVNSEKKQIEMSLKQSVVIPDDTTSSMKSYDDLAVGMNVKGTISRIQPYGVFVRLENSNLSGLCHISEVSDERVENIENVFHIGDYVKARILKLENRRISLGLKPSYFEDDEESESEEENESEENATSEEDSDSNNPAEDTPMADIDPREVKDINDGDSDGEDSDSSDEDEVESMEIDQGKSTTEKTGFSWDGVPNEDSSSDSSSEDESESLTKRQKKINKSREDQKTQNLEIKLMSEDAQPETTDDFDRLVVSSPNSSFVWIKYMAFHLSMAEVDLARDVAERALNAISYREQQEKLNIWVSYLNLEYTYGDKTTFSKVLNRAIEQNNPKRVYMQLVDIYVRDKNTEETKKVLEVMRKRFKTSKKVWIAIMEFHLRQGKAETARSILQKSLKSLAKHKHVHVITKYGQLEYELGSDDHARTIFEGVLSNYPKRIDLWNIYLDKEIKFGNQDVVRRLFERLVNMKFSAKKIKFLFKKYLDYESKHGNTKTIQHVKDLARNFVESAQS